MTASPRHADAADDGPHSPSQMLLFGQEWLRELGLPTRAFSIKGGHLAPLFPVSEVSTKVTLSSGITWMQGYTAAGKETTAITAPRAQALVVIMNLARQHGAIEITPDGSVIRKKEVIEFERGDLYKAIYGKTIAEGGIKGAGRLSDLLHKLREGTIGMGVEATVIHHGKAEEAEGVRVAQPFALGEDKIRVGKQQRWVYKFTFTHEFLDLLSKAGLFEVNLLGLKRGFSDLGVALAIFLPNKVKHRREENPYCEQLRTLLKMVKHEEADEKSSRVYRAFKREDRGHDIIAELDGMPLLDGKKMRCAIDTDIRGNHIFLAWSEGRSADLIMPSDRILEIWSEAGGDPVALETLIAKNYRKDLSQKIDDAMQKAKVPGSYAGLYCHLNALLGEAVVVRGLEEAQAHKADNPGGWAWAVIFAPSIVSLAKRYPAHGFRIEANPAVEEVFDDRPTKLRRKRKA